MKMIAEGYRGFSFFVGVNIDRMLVGLTITGALFFAGWMVSLLG